MNIIELTDIARRFFTDYFTEIQKVHKLGFIELTPNTSMLYPTLLLITNTNDHLIIELVGASDKFEDLRIKHHREISTSRYISQFCADASNPQLQINTEYTVFEGICIADLSDFYVLQQRFPAAKIFEKKYTLQRNSSSNSPLIHFGHRVESATFMNCLFIHRYLSVYRVKHVFYMAIIGKHTSKENFLLHLKSIFQKTGSVKGVLFCESGKDQDYILAGQLQNLYLQPNLRETTIGEFLKMHPEILKRALSATSLIHEPYLIWKESIKGNTDHAINPDLLVQRVDGYYDVYDIKTAALNKKSLIKGSRRRRRFIDYVGEGIAQLAHYREYFSYHANLSYAREKYGIEFFNPRYVLVVGSFDNIDKAKIIEAQRQVRDIDIIDYDTLVQLFLAS